MRNIAHTTLPRQASSDRPRTGRRWIAAACTCTAILSLCLPGNPALGAGSPAIGHCRVALRVTVFPTRRHDRVVSAYQSSSGTASCTGSLGPWLMGGKTGWSISQGTFENLLPEAPNQTRHLTTNGKGAFWAAAPRLAWFHPPMVTLTGAFDLHKVSDGIDLTGTGRLVPTREAPVASSFSFAGTATLALNHRRARSARRMTGTLTIQFAVRNSP
jgi:hypothetical protein